MQIDKLPPELKKEVESILNKNILLEFKIKKLEAQLRLIYLKKYGPKSEKLPLGQLQLLDQEICVTPAEIDKEAEQPNEEPASAPRKLRKNANHPGRTELPAHLERREVIIPCPPEDCCCSICGTDRPIIGYETSEELSVDPAIYFVKVVKREKRGSPCHSEQGVATAPSPLKIIPKSKLSNEFIIDSLIKKFDEHLPIYRQCMILERNAQIELSRQTLDQAILATGDLMRPLLPALKEDLFKSRYVQADETTMPCQTPNKKGKNHQAYIWQFSRPGGPTIFEFRMGRGREGPKEFLKGFQGKLQSDGYSGYDDLGEGIIYVGCWAHARRGFHEANALAPKDPIPMEVLNRISELYRFEAEARKSQMSVNQRAELRQKFSAPIVSELKTRLMEIRQGIDPASRLAKACNYALNQWSRLEVFLTDGMVEIDNNWAENAFRPVVLGRKNFLHIGSEEAGPKIAAIMSIRETCRRLGIDLRKYLQDVLPILGNWPSPRVAELSPLHWKLSQT